MTTSDEVKKLLRQVDFSDDDPKRVRRGLQLLKRALELMVPLAVSGLTATEGYIPFGASDGSQTEDAGLTYAPTTDILSVVGGVQLTETGTPPSTPASGKAILFASNDPDKEPVWLKTNGTSYSMLQKTQKDYDFSSPTGSTGTFYEAGFYFAPAADANLTQASTTQTLGAANIAYAAHAIAVAGGAGSTDAGVVGLRVNGTSITDAGVRTAGDTETLIADITAASANAYYETPKKWIGQVTYELFTVSGSPTTYSLDFNYGFAKYDDLGNRNFDLIDFEITGRAGANDAGFNVELLHHKSTGWTYSAAAFVPGTTPICELQTDHNTEYQLANTQSFAYKRSGLNTTIAGEADEGYLVRITTAANNAVEEASIHVSSWITL